MDKNKQFELIQNFANNMKDKREGISNIYIFESVDRNGNTTDIKYGMNLMTDAGFNAIYKQNNTFALSDSVHLYVGEDSSYFDKSTSSIGRVLFGGLAATNSTTGKDYAYPIMFSRGQTSDTGLITLVSRFGIVYYDYNISNYDSDTLITEYGIGTGYNALWTHSHIYNDRGEMSGITKKVNERMYVYIYTCLSLYEHVIMNSWAKNIYIGLTTNAIMFQRMRETDLKTYKRNNIVVTRNDGKQFTYDDTISEEDRQAGIDSIIRNYITMGSFTIWSQQGNDQGYIDGFIFQAPGCMIISPEYLLTPESVTLNGFTSNNILSATGFSDKFGRTITDSSYSSTTAPPFTTLSDVTVNTFNRNTGAWDNPCPFDNDNNMHYSNAGMETNYALPLYYWANGQIQTGYLYQNLEPSNPILSVAQGQAFLVATDKYWDQTSWITITDMTNIPVAARSCKYWIAGSNSVGVIPTRQTRPFELLDAPGGTNGYHTYTQNMFNVNHYGSRPYVDMHDYNCAVIGGTICAMNRTRGYAFMTEPTSETGVYDMFHMSYGKWFFSFRNIGSNQINKIDVSGLNDNEPDTSVLTGTLTLPFSTTINPYSGIYRTESGTGNICAQSVTTGEAVLIKVNGSNVTATLFTWQRSCCIYGTSLIAYISSTDSTHIHIYDTSVNADVGNLIELPADYLPSGIFGNNNHIWFWNGTTTYHVDVSSQARNLDICNNVNFASRANSYTLGFSCVGDVTMIYNSRSSVNDLSDVFFIDHDDPTNIRPMTPFANTSDGFFGSIVYGGCELRYINTNTLIAVIRVGCKVLSPLTSRNTKLYICDLGRYIKTGTAWRYYQFWYNPSNGYSGAYAYGESLFWDTYYLFPIVNTLALKIAGTTKTIGAFNHTKRISGKQFELGFTNMPVWGYEVNLTGKPPGEPHPILNGNGQIVDWGWS